MDPITIRYAFRPVRRSLATGRVADLFGLAAEEPAHTIADHVSLDWRLQRPFVFGQAQIIPSIEMFNTFNNANNINPLSTPALFNFDGFLRTGVGDPRQLQLAVKVTF